MLGKKCSRFTILLAIEILLCVMLLPGCFREEEIIVSLRGMDIAGQLVQAEDHAEYGSERSELTPGVYQVRVHTNLTEGQKIQVNLKCDASYFRALRGNAVTVFAGDTDVDINIYVTDKTATAYVQCDFYGAEAAALEQLEVYRTNLGNRMLLFLAVIFFVALDLLLVFRRRILEGKVTKKQQVVFWALAAGVLLAYFPYLTDYFFLGENSVPCLSRIASLAAEPQQIVLGGELLLCIPAFMMVIGFPIMTAYKMLVLILTAVTAVVSFYFLWKCVDDEYAALYGSMVYLLAPRRLSFVYEQGALGIAMAMMFLPMVCCGIYLLCKKKQVSEGNHNYKWYVILGVAGMVQCHGLAAETVVLDTVWLFIHVTVSLLAAYVFAKVCKKDGALERGVLGILALATGISSVYYVNGLAVEATPVYLYSIENLGVAVYQSTNETSASGAIWCLIASIVMLVAVIVLAAKHFGERRKRGQDGN